MNKRDDLKCEVENGWSGNAECYYQDAGKDSPSMSQPAKNKTLKCDAEYGWSGNAECYYVDEEDVKFRFDSGSRQPVSASVEVKPEADKKQVQPQVTMPLLEPTPNGELRCEAEYGWSGNAECYYVDANGHKTPANRI